MAQRTPYSYRIIHNPPITLYRPPTLVDCYTAYKSQTAVEIRTVVCVGETDNTLHIESVSGKEYHRPKAKCRTFHTLVQAVQAAIVDLEERKRLASSPEVQEHFANLIEYLTNSQGL